MSDLVIMEQGAVLSATGERLVVKKGKQELYSEPVLRVDRVLVVGNVDVTSGARKLLLTKRIDTTFFTYGMRPLGELRAFESPNAFYMLAQIDRWRDAAYRLSIARAIVAGKIANQTAMLRRFNRQSRKRGGPGIHRSLMTRLSAARRNAAAADSVDQLMGIEGSASSAYFKGFAKLLLHRDDFSGRKQHPAPDPVNALLSLGYTMITNELHGLICHNGLMPMVGFLHSVRHGRLSLACDLVEEFRQPVVDRLIWRLFNRGEFTAEHFERQPDGSLHLTEADLKRWFALFSRWLNEPRADPRGGSDASFRELFRRQTHLFAEVLLAGKGYVPYVTGEDDAGQPSADDADRTDA